MHYGAPPHIMVHALCCCTSFMVHALWCSTTLLPCSSGSLEQCVSRRTGRTKWTQHMACSFPWCQLLTFLPLRTS